MHHGGGRQRGEEPAAVSFGPEPRVEHREDTAVAPVTDQPPKPLLEREDGQGYLVLAERVAAGFADRVNACRGDRVADAAHVAQLVIWTTGSTEGLRWEISHLLKSVPPAKLVVWAHPPLLRLDRVEREQEWAAFRASLGKVFPKQLPERLGKTRFIWFKEDWEPVPVSPRWGFFGALFRIFRNAQTVALKQMLRQKSTLVHA